MPATTTQPEHHPAKPEPVAIGGVGGSGTRLIAAILSELGFDMGHDINRANDNLAFTLLFKDSQLWPLSENREQIDRSLGIFLKTMYFRDSLSDQDIGYINGLARQTRLDAPQEWLQQRVERLLDSPTDHRPPERWGWKEPNTHIFLPCLVERIPGLKYIHVMRHGLDMAYSANQAQLKLWGEALTGDAVTHGGPEASFHYWCAVHQRVLEQGKNMRGNLLLLNFDVFCANPKAGLQELLSFLALDVADSTRRRVLALIHPPVSIGRHKNEKPLSPAGSDLKVLREMGFERK